MVAGGKSREKLMDVFLKRYREIRAACDETLLERMVRQKVYPDSFDWWQRFMQDKDPDNVIDEIMKTSQNTERILFNIDIAIGKYAELAKYEGLQSWRQYDALYSVYFSTPKIKIRDVAKKYGVKKSAIYKDVKIAKSRLTALLFGNPEDHQTDSSEHE